jgi:hypothetical protein
MSGVGRSDVITQKAPTAWIRLPKFATRLVVQMAAKTG